MADTFFHREVVARAQHNNETVEVTQDTAGITKGNYTWTRRLTRPNNANDDAQGANEEYESNKIPR